MAKKKRNKLKVKKDIIILRPKEDLEIDLTPPEIIEIRKLLAQLRRNLA